MSKQIKENLTNEMLTKHFSDNFSLALKAIETAANSIHAGRETNLGSVLDELAKAQGSKEQQSA